VVDWQGRFPSSPGPIIGKLGVVGGRLVLDDLVSDDIGPGEAMEITAAGAVAEHPSILPGLVERAEVPGEDPVGRLGRVAAFGPLPCEPPQVRVQLAEGDGGYLCPVVGGPPADDRVQALEDRAGVAPVQGAQLVAEPCPDSSDRRVAGLISSLRR
jgi:hypothetical protein